MDVDTACIAHNVGGLCHDCGGYRFSLFFEAFAFRFDCFKFRLSGFHSGFQRCHRCFQCAQIGFEGYDIIKFRLFFRREYNGLFVTVVSIALVLSTYTEKVTAAPVLSTPL